MNEPDASLLLVEDDPSNRRLMELQLGKLGWRVQAFADAESALLAWRRESHAAVVTDQELPGMSGDVLAATIRAESADPAVPWVVVVTGVRESHRHRHFLAAGANGVLVKPATLEAIQRVVGGDSSRERITRRSGAVAGTVSLDPKRLMRLIGPEMIDEIDRLIEIFIEGAERACNRIEKDSQLDSTIDLAPFLHRQKSAASAVGALRFCAMCEEAERDPPNSPPQVEALLGELRRELLEVGAAARALRSDATAQGELTPCCEDRES